MVFILARGILTRFGMEQPGQRPGRQGQVGPRPVSARPRPRPEEGLEVEVAAAAQESREDAAPAVEASQGRHAREVRAANEYSYNDR